MRHADGSTQRSAASQAPQARQVIGGPELEATSNTPAWIGEPRPVITADDVQSVATYGEPHLDPRLDGGRLTRADVIAMTGPDDWTGDWESLTPAAAAIIAADLNERYER